MTAKWKIGGFTPNCPSGKKGYVSRREAKEALSSIRHARNRELHEAKLAVYECLHCGFWHLGTMPAWKREGLDQPEGYGRTSA